MSSSIHDELRLKGYIDFGKKIMLYRGEWMLLKVGDTYLAHTDGREAEVLTVRRLEVQKRSTGMTVGKVFPKERKKKLYDLHEVVKILLVDNPEYKETSSDGNERTDKREQDAREPVRKAPGTPRRNRPGPREPGKPGRTAYHQPKQAGVREEDEGSS